MAQITERAPTATTDVATEGGAPAPIKRKRPSIGSYAARYGMLIAFLVLLVIFLTTNANFRDPTNLLNILQQSSIIGVVACGMVIIIIAGGFDLSVGATGAAAAVAGAFIMTSTQSIFLGVLAGLIVGVAAGFLNGLLVSRVGITPFVATLGSTSLITGIIYAATNALPISGIPSGFINFGLGKIGVIPIPAIVFIAIAILVFLMLKWTRIGHYVYAVGSSRDASRLAGVPVERVLLFTFVAGGILAGLGGLMTLGQTGIGQPSSGTDWPLTAIAAVVVGGTPLRGGVGGVHSAVIGTLLLGVLGNALDLYGVSPYWQPAVTGIVVLLAVGVDSYRRKSSGGME